MTEVEPISERTLKMVLEYDGTDFLGWETQVDGRTVQGVVEEAFYCITRQAVAIAGSGRTDSGVHARGQVASCRLRSRLDLRKLHLGLNAVLPDDVVLASLEEVSSDFHARKSARSKRYRYTVLNSRQRRPLTRFHAYHVPRPLAATSMREALSHLIGTHDFTAFAREARRKKSCVRTILAAELLEEGPYLHFEFTGTGFLYNMIRILVGTLVEIGLGKRPASEFSELLRSRPRAEAGLTVPPHGLCLMEVHYDASPSVGFE